jgi:hypothetical protein
MPLGAGYNAYKKDGKNVEHWIDSEGRIQIVVTQEKEELYSHVFCGVCRDATFPVCTKTCTMLRFCK